MRKENTTDQMIEETLSKFKDISPMMTVLSDENRQKIIAELGLKDMLNVTELTKLIPLSRPAISHHLKLLKQAGLINVKKEGTENFYFLTIKEAIVHMRDLLDHIESVCDLV
jgi:DNA-binding transcriptional ArsR family regulator